MLMANDEPKAAARLLYAALPAADFSATSLRTLATAIEREEPYENLPNSVKICLIRLGMACRLVDLPGLVPSDGSLAPTAGEIGPPSGPTPIEAEIMEKNESVE
jgi:hypothetical protein